MKTDPRTMIISGVTLLFIIIIGVSFMKVKKDNGSSPRRPRPDQPSVVRNPNENNEERSNRPRSERPSVRNPNENNEERSKWNGPANSRISIEKLRELLKEKEIMV